MVIVHYRHHFCVYTGSEAAAAGLQPGQCVLKVNGNNMNQSSYQEVLEHFSGHQPVLEQQDAVRINTALCLTLHYVFFLIGYVVHIWLSQRLFASDTLYSACFLPL